jgi:tetratricopeptide (TPR) repeat protein
VKYFCFIVIINMEVQMKRGSRRSTKEVSKSASKAASRTKHFHRSRPDLWKLDNTSDLDLILEKDRPIQDILGFSRDSVAMLFEHAIGFLQMNRPDEAVLSFQLLTKLNPYIADFWLGLGIAYFNSEEYPKAQEALMMALALDPSRFEVYSYAIDCCIEMKNFQQAEALLEEAISYAKKHRRDEECLFILHESSKLKEKIESYKT